MISITDAMIGLFIGLILASIGVLAAFSWGLPIIVRQFGRCRMTLENSAQFLAGVLALLAFFTIARSSNIIFALLIHPWPIEARPTQALINLAIVGGTLVTYYLAMLTWYVGRGYEHSERFKTVWIAAIVIAVLGGAFGAHEIRPMFFEDGGQKAESAAAFIPPKIRH